MPSPMPSSATSVAVLCLGKNGVSAREDAVATEEPLEIQVSHSRRGVRAVKSLSVTMRTPGNDAELGAGFLLSEGLLMGRESVEDIELLPPGNVVRVVFREGVELDLAGLERHFYTTSSCGVCGKSSLEALRVKCGTRLVPGVPIWTAEAVHGLPEKLRATQAVFEQTGGLHAAALFDAAGELLSVREDVGRHNAVDKLIGAEWLAGRVDLSQRLLFVSGRTSFELMQKALMAGIPMLASVGAPSSLAVELARQYGATLLGFVREGRFNIYAGAERLPALFRA